MDIQFCDNCENFMFIYLDKKELLYSCKNCNFQKKGEKTTRCIYRNDIQNKEKIQEINVKMNDFIKYDPTLPSINNDNISCPKCSNKDILYILNNVDEMKYTYICKADQCNQQWSN